MAVSTNEKQVEWEGDGSTWDTVTGSGTVTSDPVTHSTNAVSATAQLKADHSGTPGAGDYVDFYILPSLGDPDEANNNEYATADTTHAIFLARVNCNVSDPAQTVVELPWPLLESKIHAINNAGENVNVSATILEQTVT